MYTTSRSLPIFNSRRFETCLLRKTLKVSGIDPYYAFSTKGKEETIDFRVPMPDRAGTAGRGKTATRLVRMDEPVFNVRGWGSHP